MSMATHRILLSCLLFVSAHGDGHGIFCSTQFNWWFSHGENAESTVFRLARENGGGSLTLCEMQDNANQLYYDYKARGGLGFPNGGGFEKNCIDLHKSKGNTDQGAVPAGGCAFSYPVEANSTCRLKIFGPGEAKELQWCQGNIVGSLRVQDGTDGSRNPDAECGDHTDFHLVGNTDGHHAFQNSYILFNVFANTLLSICSAPGPAPVGAAAGTNEDQEHVVIALLAVAVAVAVLSLALMVVVLRRVSKISSATPTANEKLSSSAVL